jgi:hypothetical protein
MLNRLLVSVLLLGFLTTTYADESSSQAIEKQQQLSKSLVTLKPFIAKYTFFYHGDALGTGIRQLEKLENGDYLYRYHSDAKWMIFSDKRDEKTTVKIENNIVIPTHYRYERTGTGKDKLVEWQYDMLKNRAINVKKQLAQVIDFPKNTQDPLSYHLQHRINLMQDSSLSQYKYPVINSSGNISDKIYVYDGKESLDLPYGKVETLRFKREVKSKRRVTYAWFAPKLECLLVKLNQYKKDKQEFEIQLNTVDFKK